ncbi:hypothetical protein PDE_02183 [Penicillium oxalicum 114-2]|uniref:Uncharacterized protein n=1 Tax=Penicillium oxalicum (strain 114-2 / CGMCC 5302) TaxID=933388 RepID=S7Z9E0_PENO1|nr:hypothetical protein PDE_02183 [Penicillium oxalicum 114-2]
MWLPDQPDDLPTPPFRKLAVSKDSSPLPLLLNSNVVSTRPPLSIPFNSPRRRRTKKFHHNGELKASSSVLIQLRRNQH